MYLQKIAYMIVFECNFRKVYLKGALIIKSNKKVKIIFLDLDDTLLNSEECIDNNTRAAIKECSNKGILIGYITARAPRKTGKFLEGLPCDCIAYYNGAIIKAKDELIGSYGINYYEGLELISSIRKDMPELSISAYLEPFCYIKNQVRIAKTQEVTDLDLFNLTPSDFQRIRIVSDNNDYEGLLKYQSNKLLFTYSTHGSVVISNATACKKNAVNKIIDYFHIDKSEVLSFGDDINDIGMLEASGTGVAMANAVQELKDMADYVTLSNDEEGIEVYLNEFILQ